MIAGLADGRYHGSDQSHVSTIITHLARPASSHKWGVCLCGCFTYSMTLWTEDVTLELYANNQFNYLCLCTCISLDVLSRLLMENQRKRITYRYCSLPSQCRRMGSVGSCVPTLDTRGGDIGEWLLSDKKNSTGTKHRSEFSMSWWAENHLCHFALENHQEQGDDLALGAFSTSSVHN